MPSNPKHNKFLESAWPAHSQAKETFKAAASVLEIRLAAIRQIVDIFDADVIIETEALSARVDAWNAAVIEALDLLDSTLHIARDASLTKVALNSDLDRDHAAYVLRIKQLQLDIETLEKSGAINESRRCADSFLVDTVFAHLLAKDATSPGASRMKRAVAKMVGFDEELAKYRDLSVYADVARAWIDAAKVAIDEIWQLVTAVDKRMANEKATTAALLESAIETVRRAWTALFELLREQATEFAMIEVDTACGVAREVAAMAVRNGRSPDAAISVPFAAEQEECLEWMRQCKAELKFFDDLLNSTL